MAGLSNSIERFIKDLLEQTEDGIVEIGRNDLANQFNCAPSQINYVLTTRFTPYKGYYIESRRGGSGYIKIMKLTFTEESSIDQIINDVIGDSITKDMAYNIVNSLYEEEILSKREGQLILHALEDVALTNVNINYRNIVRADILRNMLLAFLR
ncbi:CtsR family transcriptional regulator [Miniphocaeibacter halophilus]|uniref:CtsR family transcriptional regulator n=1 Tax=Miniphocaeibacter halophilus TaxID=2931922 RepID=A0AC61MR85_9FIRM|nr:CtsR family transcriptional regulator [Miniphocaeibacter halophilus]QQK08092.1 CtsR family transcriptional regulator [Miniphocaeibacter halophilus]